ncbi:MAG: histidine phosphatase family protein, partial [Acidimicrobiales bacterium]
FGAYEGRPLTELGRDASGIFDGKVVDATTRPEGGESLDEFFNRVRSFIDFLRAKDDQRRALLVTHGGTIRVIRAYGVGAQMQGLVWDRVANASIWSVTFNGPGH